MDELDHDRSSGSKDAPGNPDEHVKFHDSLEEAAEIIHKIYTCGHRCLDYEPTDNAFAGSLECPNDYGYSSNACFFLTENERMLQEDLTRPTDLFEKFIQPNCGRHQDCPRCKILKQKNFISQDKYYTDMSKNITREPKGDGTYHIRADFVLADTPEKLFPKSNLKEAIGHCRKEVAKADKQGYREELDKQVKDRIDRGVLRELTEEEKINLPNKAHNFATYSVVFNPRSESTPVRLVTNTSALNNGMSISTAERYPKQSLNSILAVLWAFSILPTPSIGDLSKAYNQIKISCLLRRPQSVSHDIARYRTI